VSADEHHARARRIVLTEADEAILAAAGDGWHRAQQSGIHGLYADRRHRHRHRAHPAVPAGTLRLWFRIKPQGALSVEAGAGPARGHGERIAVPAARE
jgi:hypothetical protein